MIKWLRKLFYKHKHLLTEDKLIVSGNGYTEYELRFCKTCNAIVWKLTKNFN